MHFLNRPVPRGPQLLQGVWPDAHCAVAGVCFLRGSAISGAAALLVGAGRAVDQPAARLSARRSPTADRRR